MEGPTGHILKSNNVEMEGRFQLDAEQILTGSANERNVASTVPQAHIVENHPEYAVMEITCSCGAKTHVRCEYTDAKSADRDPNQENNGENKNED